MKKIVLIPFICASFSITAFAKTYCQNAYKTIEEETLGAYTKRIQHAKNSPLVVTHLNETLTADQKGKDRFIFAGDLHGSWPMYGALLAAFDLIQPDYLALEVAEDADQKKLWDDFNKTSIDDTQFSAIAKSVSKLLESWDQRYSTWASPYTEIIGVNWNGRPMFELILAAKKRGIQIVPIDTQECYRLEAPVGHRSVLVRNSVWAKNIYSLKGTTIVFGGRPHFSSTLKDNVQNYVIELRKKNKLAPASISFIDYMSPEELKFEAEFVTKYYTDAGY